MRFHRNLVEGVIQILDQIFNDGTYADKALEQHLRKNRQWGSRDRGFVAETVYEIVRWKRLYAEISGVTPPLKTQDLYGIFAVWAILNNIGLPDWPEFRRITKKTILARHKPLLKIRKFRESVPDWLDELGEESLGSDLWSQELAALNTQAPVILRANRLLTSPELLKEKLKAEGIDTDLLPKYPDALQLQKRGNVFRTESFKAGLFEVQDAASQTVAPFLEVEPGMRVIDACAGAGGKTLHLASLMKNKGQLIALDIYPQKLKELKKRAKRAKAFNIETRLISDAKVIKRLKGSADRVLIDAPCTGLGVLRRNPDAKWKLEAAFLERVCETQQELLENYSGLVKKDGVLVYATCSILPKENSKQVETFLKHPAGNGFRLVAERSMYASTDGFDGFYMARLQRVE